MSAASSAPAPEASKPRFPALGGRLFAIFLSGFMGPPLAILTLFVFSVITTLIHDPSAIKALDTGMLVAVPFSPLAGWPIPMLIGLIGLAFTARAQRISLTSVLVTTLLCLLPFYWNGPVMLLSALISAALCWRITKNWHSPEPTP